MSAYRYVVFPTGAAPSADELRTLRRYAEQLNNHIAYGVRRRDGALAIACEAEPFDRLRGLEPAFDELLLHWSARGAEVEQKLPFVKDTARWKRLEAESAKHPASKHHAATPPKAAADDAPERRSPVERSADARLAEASGRLAAARAAARAESYQRWAAVLPYVFWALGATAVLAVGGYIGSRLLGSDVESRSSTIERMAADGDKEPLASQANREAESDSAAAADTSALE